MKRGVFEIIRRGVDNTIANWQLILIRIGELALFGVLAVAALILAVVPILVSVGIEISKISTVDDVEAAMFALMQRWILLVWVFAIISVLLLLYVLIHSFFEAGSARVYVDAERVAGPALEGPRARFRVFSMERWFAGARAGWWPLFWIYNLAWGAAGLILLIPLLPTLAGMLLLRERPPAAIATGCIGLVITGLLMMVVGAATGMWVNRAIAEWAARHTGARASLAAGWAAIRGDLGRHLLIFLTMFVIALAGSSFFSSLSFLAGFSDAVNRNNGLFALFMMPLQVFGSMLNSVFSAILGAWYLAAYSALATEGRGAE